MAHVGYRLSGVAGHRVNPCPYGQFRSGDSGTKFMCHLGKPVQGGRFYNMVCVAYGSDDELFADVVENGYLAASRAKGCRYEYQVLAWALRNQIVLHIDHEMARKVPDTRWVTLMVAGVKQHARRFTPCIDHGSPCPDRRGARDTKRRHTGILLGHLGTPHG